MSLFMTLKEQKLLVSMLKEDVTATTQKIYKNKINFYRAMKNLKNIGLVRVSTIQNSGTKIWTHTEDGYFMARMLKFPPKKVSN